MQVHQEVTDPALQIIPDTVQDDATTDVDEFDVGEAILRLVDGLVDLFVVANSITKVLDGHVGVQALVVGAGGLDLEDIGMDDLFIVAFGLDEHGGDALGGATIMNPPAAGFGGVGGIQDGHQALTVGEPLDQVGHGRLGRGATQTLPLRVGGVEEVRGGMGGVVASVGSDVEDPGLDREPGQIPHH